MIRYTFPWNFIPRSSRTAVLPRALFAINLAFICAQQSSQSPRRLSARDSNEVAWQWRGFRPVLRRSGEKLKRSDRQRQRARLVRASFCFVLRVSPSGRGPAGCADGTCYQVEFQGHVALRIPPRDKDFAQPSYVNEAGDARSTETALSERARMRDKSPPSVSSLHRRNEIPLSSREFWFAASGIQKDHDPEERPFLREFN